MNNITIPLNAFKAVQKAQSTEQARYYICGVFVEDETLVATNGSVLLRYTLGDDATGVAEPFILQVDPNEKAMKPKDSDHVYMHVDLERLIVETRYHNPSTGEVGKRLGVCACVVIDGTFPTYRRVIPDNTNATPCNDFAYDPAHIAIFAAAAKIAGANKALKIIRGTTSGAPANVHFSGKPELDGVIMPYKF